MIKSRLSPLARLLWALAMLFSMTACQQEQATPVAPADGATSTDILTSAEDGLVGSFSAYVDMPDGVKIAVQVWLPEQVTVTGEGQPVPTIVMFTRYWRWGLSDPPRTEVPEPTRQSLAAGYAYVSVDVRGTGASTGTRGSEFSLAEVRDMPEVIDWISTRAWSNGRVATMGVSYPGNTAELAALYRHPALVAAVPRFTDFDWYNSIVLPGGLKNWYIAVRWGNNVRKMDLNDLSLFGEHSGEATAENPRMLGVAPVASDIDGSIFARALQEHQDNVSLADSLGDLVFRDEYPVAMSLDDPGTHATSIHRLKTEFEASGLPMMHWGSWSDAGTAAGILARFASFDAPYRYLIGAWSHGAGFDTSPFAADDAQPVPTIDEQYRQIFEFLEPYTRGDAKPAPPRRELTYYTMGENRWKTTDTWPPAGHQLERWWLGQSNRLSDAAPASEQGADQYAVDFSVGSGKTTRWATQLGGGDVIYPDRAEPDKKLLTYTSPVLQSDLEITGTPVVHLQLSSSHTDGLVIGYLEAVGPDGVVRMLTEGGLRLVHRKVSEERRTYPTWGPYHSFEQVDGMPMEPNQVTEVSFAMLPVSVRVPAGHAIRLALAGHDADTFVRVPEEGDPVWQIQRNARYSSALDLPVIVASGVQQ